MEDMIMSFPCKHAIRSLGREINMITRRHTCIARNESDKVIGSLNERAH